MNTPLGQSQSFAKAEIAGTLILAPDGLANAAQLALVTQLGLSPQTNILVGNIHADQGFAYGIMAIPNNLVNSGSAPRIYWFVAQQSNAGWQVAIEHTTKFYALLKSIPSTSAASRIVQYVGSGLSNVDLIDAVQNTVIAHLSLPSNQTVIVTDVKTDGTFAIGDFIIPSIGYSGTGPVNNELFSATYGVQGWQVGLESEYKYRTALNAGAVQNIRVPDTQDYIPPGVSPDLIATAQKALIAYLGGTPATGIWVGNIKAGQDVAVGTLVIPTANNAKIAPKNYYFIASRVNKVWQVAFPFTSSFYQLLSASYFPLEMIPLQDRQYFLPLDDTGAVIRAAQQALITYLGDVPPVGMSVGNVKIEGDFASGTVLTFAPPDPDSGPQIYVFIAQKTGQTWAIAFKGTSKYDAMLPNVRLSLTNPPAR